MALLEQLLHLLHVVLAACQQGSHELGGVVGLHVSGLVGHPGVAGGMRLVERIGGELFPVGPYLLQYLRIVAVLRAALDELRLHLIHNVLLLLAHRLAQGIALASGEACQFARKQHDLFLVDRDAVGVAEVFFAGF